MAGITCQSNSSIHSYSTYNGSVFSTASSIRMPDTKLHENTSKAAFLHDNIHGVIVQLAFNIELSGVY